MLFGILRFLHNCYLRPTWNVTSTVMKHVWQKKQTRLFRGFQVSRENLTPEKKIVGPGIGRYLRTDRTAVVIMVVVIVWVQIHYFMFWKAKSKLYFFLRNKMVRYWYGGGVVCLESNKKGDHKIFNVYPPSKQLNGRIRIR